MKVLVGVKQVPGAPEVRYVAGVNRIERGAEGNRMNPHDRGALSCARALCGAPGDEVVAFTMGPEQAREVLEEAIRAGADRAVHLCDMRFAGADTLATSRALAQLCRTEQPDLVLFGRIALDGGTSQIAPQVGELLSWPSVTEVADLALEGSGVAVSRRLGTETERWHVDLPAVCSVDLLEAEEPLVAPQGPLASGSVTTLDADALGGDDTGYGIRGSATFVQRIDPVDPLRAARVVTDPASAAHIVSSAGGAGGAGSAGGAGGAEVPSPSLASLAADGRAPGEPSQGSGAATRARELWVVVDGSGRPERSAEGLAAGAQVAAALGADVVAVVLGDVDAHTLERLSSEGADRVIELPTGAPATGAARLEVAIDALATLVEERSPRGVIGPWTPRGRLCMARVAARLEVGLTGDVVGLEVSPRPGSSDVVDLVWLKPAWNGAALARVVARSSVAMGTLRPASVTPLPRTPREAAVLERIEAAPAVVGRRHARLVEPADGASVPVEEAAVVVCIGAVSPETARQAAYAAHHLGWAITGTRAAVAAGLVPPRSGLVPERYSLSPRLAMGVGVERAEDLAPLRGAATIVTVDPDGHAPAHSVADVAVLCDPDALFASLTG